MNAHVSRPLALAFLAVALGILLSLVVVFC